MTVNRTSLELRIPSNLNVDSLIPATLKDAKREKYRDGIYYFLDLLFPRPWDFKKRKQLSDAGYISLTAPELKKVIGPEYHDIMTWLTAAGVIKVNKKFTIGKHSMGYRITRQYYIETVTVTITNKGMCERYSKRKSKTRKERAQSISSIPFITKWLDNQYIDIDLTGGHNFIETYRVMMLEKWSTNSFTSELKRTEAKCRIQNRGFYQRYVVEKIYRGEIGIISKLTQSALQLYPPLCCRYR